jgi:hypothetical protein
MQKCCELPFFKPFVNSVSDEHLSILLVQYDRFLFFSFVICTTKSNTVTLNILQLNIEEVFIINRTDWPN